MKVIKRPCRWASLAIALFILSGLSTGAQSAAGGNLNGTWKISAPQTSFTPEGGEIPFTEIGRKRYLENKSLRTAGEYDEYDRMISRCASPGLPRIMLTSERFQIFQQPHLVVFAFEWNRNRRSITLPGGLTTQRSQLPGGAADIVGSAMGKSAGHWDGDTLVVATDKFMETTLIDDLVPHGYDLKVTERMRLKNRDTLEVRITIEDPEYFTRPWHTAVTYRRQPEAILREDVCLDRLLGPAPLPTT